MTTDLESSRPSRRTYWTRSTGVNTQMRLAILVAIGYHGGLLFTGTFRRTYDAYVHIFLADHYSRSWFSFFEERWYTGFSVASYPPATHQLISLVSRLTGLEVAFVLVQVAAVVLLVVGVFRFSRLWVSDEAAGFAALFISTSTALAQTVHIFGQLPTVLALGFFLNALPSAYQWMVAGEIRSLFESLALVAATVATHHLTTILVAVSLLTPVFFAAVIDSGNRPDGYVFRGTDVRGRLFEKLQRHGPTIGRGVLLALSCILIVGVVVLPYWLWGASDPVAQVPIPHASRANFVTDSAAGLMFLIIPWGATILIMPYVIWSAMTRRSSVLGLSALVMVLLGLGSTTPVARALLGPAFDILTLDRFTLWAIVALSPFIGELLHSVWSGEIANRLSQHYGPPANQTVKMLIAVAIVVPLAVTSNLAQLLNLQPDHVDPGPISEFLAKDRHDEWRYITLGFGDQMAWLSANTDAANLEGNYHTARRLPELVISPVERLDGAKFRGREGLDTLEAVISQPGKYGLKYIFSIDEFYDPLLYFTGWQQLERLDNGAVVWEREDVPIPIPPPQDIEVTALEILWGVLPLISVAAGLLAMLMATRHRGRHMKQPPWDRRLPAVMDLFGAVSDYVSERSDGHLVNKTREEPSEAERVDVQLHALYLSSLVGLVMIVVVAIGPAVDLFDRSPEAIASEFYEDLNDRRLDEAYAALDPLGRPTFEVFLREQALDVGLLASYSILDDVRTATVHLSDERAEVTLALARLTAFETIQEVVNVQMVKRDGTWFLSFEEPIPPAVAQAVVSRPSVDYADPTDLRGSIEPREVAAVATRPAVDIHSARTVISDGQLFVVGELKNQDALPIDVSIQATAFSQNGETLAIATGSHTMLHQLRPGETTPFKIPFDGLADTAPNGDPIIAAGVEWIELAAKGVVTARGLNRNLSLEDVTIETSGAELHITGAVTNRGAATALVPQLLVSLQDSSGDIAWVEGHFLNKGLNTQSTGGFDITSVRPTSIERTDIRVVVIDNTPESEPRPNPIFVLPSDSGFAAVSLSVIAFEERP